MYCWIDKKLSLSQRRSYMMITWLAVVCALSSLWVGQTSFGQVATSNPVPSNTVTIAKISSTADALLEGSQTTDASVKSYTKLPRLGTPNASNQDSRTLKFGSETCQNIGIARAAVRAGDMSRAVALIDMDCFYVQVEQRENKATRGIPCAVVQGTGLLIAVSYEARDRGVNRGHRVKDAKAICPEIHLFNVPEPRGKADLTRYRDAGAEVITVLSEFGRCVVERASIDEAYVDMTQEVNARLVAMETGNITTDQLPNTFVVGWETEDDGKTGSNPGGVAAWLRDLDECDRRLAVAAIVTEEMRAAVLRQCHFHCSAGIAHNKLLAKLICSRHKPNKQTVLPLSAVDILFETIPVQKIRLLGGKLGCDVTEQLGVEFVGELVQFSEKQLQLEFGEKQGSWLYQVCRGVDNEPVKQRKLAKSIGCGKVFAGPDLLNTEEKIKHWLRMMSSELEERLIKDKHENQREARLLTVSMRTEGRAGSVDGSRSCPISHYSADKLHSDAWLLLHKFQQPRDSHNNPCTWPPVIRSLYMVASKFEGLQSNTSSIKQFVFKTLSSTVCGSSACEARSSYPLCGSSAQMVRSSDPLYGSSTTVDRSCSSLHGSSATVVRSSDPTDVLSVSMSASSDMVSRSSDLKCGSSDLMSGSAASSSGSSACVIRSADLTPGSLPSMCGSYPGSAKHDDHTCITTDTLATPHRASCTRVQPQLDTLTDHSDHHVTYSCDGDPASEPQVKGHPAGHHLRLHDCVCGNDSSSHGKLLSLSGTCEDIPTEDSESDSRNVLGKTDDKIDVKHVDGECQTYYAVEPVTTVTSNDDADSQCIGDAFGDTVKCDKCGISVGVWELTEHSDFHLAVELQEKETPKSGGKRRSTDGASNAAKRRSSVKHAATLHQFFDAA